MRHSAPLATSDLTRTDDDMKTRLAKASLIAAAILVNLVIAADQASAGLKTGICSDGEGGAIECCRPCFFFCECDVIVE
jgi:hypothetical protein